MNVIGVEHLTLETRDPIQPTLARYGFDLGHQHIGRDDVSVAVFRASECLGLASQPPAWFGVEEQPEDAAAYYWCATPDSDDRPAGAPLHVSTTVPYLEPRYGDSWIAFVVEIPETEE